MSTATSRMSAIQGSCERLLIRRRPARADHSAWRVPSSPTVEIGIGQSVAEAVAGLAHGHDACRVRRVGLELATQVGDMDVAGAGVADVCALPQVFHDLATGEHLARPARKEREHPELGVRDVHGLAAYENGVAGEIDRNTGVVDGRRGGSGLPIEVTTP